MTDFSTTDTVVDRLVASASAGRGLWIGLDTDRSPRHELLRLELESAARLQLIGDTHVTVAHLGKSNGRREVEAAVTACHVLSRMLHVTSVSVEGLGRLRDHVVALLAPRWLDDVAAHVDRCLADHHVYADRSFAGVRHTSIGVVKSGAAPGLPRVDAYALRMLELTVNCGGVDLGFPLQPEKPGVF